MIEPSYHVKHYASGRQRLLPATLDRFFIRECPKLFGPVLRQKLVQEIVALVERQLPAKDHLRPGQCVWNAISRFTRPDSPNRRLVPVIVTLVAPEDIEARLRGESIRTIRLRAIRRVLEEAYRQDALLSMRDLGLLTWHADSTMTTLRQLVESQCGETMPHPGSLQDFGSCLSHKVAIVTRVVYGHQDPLQVSRETKHTPQAVDRYVKDFQRVRTCFRHQPEIDFIHQVTGMSKRLIQEYIDIIQANEKGA
jgi:hypothetical protein